MDRKILGGFKMSRRKKIENATSLKEENSGNKADVIENIESTMKYLVKRLTTGDSYPEIRMESKKIILTSKKCPDPNKPVIEFGFDLRDQHVTVNSSFKIGENDMVSLSKIRPFLNGSKCKTTEKGDLIKMSFEIENPKKETSRKKITEIVESMNDLFSVSTSRRPNKSKRTTPEVDSGQ